MATERKKMQKSWMWASHTGGVEGAIIELEENRVQWFDELGCACSASDNEQKLEDFIANGSHFLTPPDDVIEEMRTYIQDEIPN
jgi:hypothetical protein